MDLQFVGDVIEWRGPAPYFFVELTPEAADAVHAISGLVTYGWGCIPVTVTIGNSTWTTSLMPRNGGYLLPLRKLIREREEISVRVPVKLTV